MSTEPRFYVSLIWEVMQTCKFAAVKKGRRSKRVEPTSVKIEILILYKKHLQFPLDQTFLDFQACKFA